MDHHKQCGPSKIKYDMQFITKYNTPALDIPEIRNSMSQYNSFDLAEDVVTKLSNWRKFLMHW
jgi:hypothetical protein